MIQARFEPAALLRASLLLTAALALVTALVAPADARCARCDESRITEPEEIDVAFPTRSGGRAKVSRIVLLSHWGVSIAEAPRRAEATDEDRIDVRGAIGDAGGLGRIFPRRLTAYVTADRRVGLVYQKDGDLYIDVRDLLLDGLPVDGAHGVALLTRTPFRRRIVGLRLSLDFDLVSRDAAAPEALGEPVGDVYMTGSGLLLAPPVSTLPGAW